MNKGRRRGIVLLDRELRMAKAVPWIMNLLRKKPPKEQVKSKAREPSSEEFDGQGSRQGERLKLEPGRKGANQNKQRRKKELNEIRAMAIIVIKS